MTFIRFVLSAMQSPNRLFWALEGGQIRAYKRTNWSEVIGQAGQPFPSFLEPKKRFWLSQYLRSRKRSRRPGASDRVRFWKVHSYERSLYNTNKWVWNDLESHRYDLDRHTVMYGSYVLRTASLYMQGGQPAAQYYQVEILIYIVSYNTPHMACQCHMMIDLPSV